MGDLIQLRRGEGGASAVADAAAGASASTNVRPPGYAVQRCIHCLAEVRLPLDDGTEEYWFEVADRMRFFEQAHVKCESVWDGKKGKKR